MMGNLGVLDRPETRTAAVPYPVQSAIRRRHGHGERRTCGIAGFAFDQPTSFAAKQFWLLVGYRQIGCNKNLNGRFCGQARLQRAVPSLGMS